MCIRELMGKNKSKTKGNKFELDISKYLTEKFGESFTRVPNSGAFIGGQNQVRKDQLSDNQIRLFKGDIIPPDTMSNLVIECKHYADFPFHKLIGDHSIPLLDGWISEVEFDAGEVDLWFLIWKISRHGTYILCDDRWAFNHNPRDSVWYKSYVINELDTFLGDDGNVDFIRKIFEK